MINKLKSTINKELLKRVPTEKYKELGFLAINEANGQLFAVSYNTQNPAMIAQTTELIQKIYNLSPKFIPLPKTQFDELFEFCFPKMENSEKSPKESVVQKPGAAQNSETLELKIDKTSSTGRKRIGKMLIDKGYINEDQLNKALAVSKGKQEPVGSTLVAMGYINVEQLKETLTEQLGVECVDAKKIRINEDLMNLFPKDFMNENKLVPVSSDGRTIIVGMVNPLDKKVLNDIVFLTGLNPTPKLLTFYEYERTVLAFLKENERKAKLFQHIDKENLEVKEDTLWEQVEKAVKDDSSAISRFANQVITDAIDSKASDVHVEPRLNNYIVRYRTDGILKKVIEIPQKLESTVISRFKVLARMNIAEHRRSQDGSFSIKYKGKTYDCRVNTIPVAAKEKMVIRILQPSSSITVHDNEIKLAGASEDDLEKIERMIKVPHGIILASGPTGSGKTTSLYSIINHLNNEEVNITTIEDPVEIKLEGINQIQVNPKADITFATCLRAILRQDPDIILVGEIRDYETLESAIAAALTGHLVLSTIHTNSAASTVTRLIQMGAPHYLVGSSLAGIISQRLVRRLCPHCKQEYEPTRQELRQIALNREDIEALMNRKFYKPNGCAQCFYEGFLGRVGVFEIMPINKEIKKLISATASDVEIEEAAVGSGMKTLRQSCLEHILNGEIPITEYVRVLGVISE